MRVPCVGAVVLDGEGRLLLVRRGHAPSEGLWSVPGGRVEPGEAPRAAVRREVREETGLDVEVGSLLGMVDVAADDDGGTVYVVEDFACVVAGAHDAVAGDDATDVRWVDRDAFDRLPLVPGLRQALNGWSALPR